MPISRSKYRRLRYQTRLSYSHERASKGFFVGHPHSTPKATARGAGWPDPAKPRKPRKRKKGFLRRSYPR
jgi:hypothetical protein